MPQAAFLPILIGTSAGTAVAGTIGAKMQSGAIKDAAKAEAQAMAYAAELEKEYADKALAEQQRQFNTTISMIAPYYNAGLVGLNALMYGLGAPYSAQSPFAGTATTAANIPIASMTSGVPPTSTVTAVPASGAYSDTSAANMPANITAATPTPDQVRRAQLRADVFGTAGPAEISSARQRMFAITQEMNQLQDQLAGGNLDYAQAQAIAQKLQSLHDEYANLSALVAQNPQSDIGFIPSGVSQDSFERQYSIAANNANNAMLEAQDLQKRLNAGEFDNDPDKRAAVTARIDELTRYAQEQTDIANSAAAAVSTGSGGTSTSTAGTVGANAGATGQASQLPSQDEIANTIGKMVPLGSLLAPVEQLPYFQMDPGYLFRLQEGMKAIERAATARGGLLSGGTAKALERYAQGLASQEYQAAWNRAAQNQLNQYNRLAALAGVGQQAGQFISGAGENYANALGNIYGSLGANLGNLAVGAGQARASSMINSANVWSNYLNNLANLGMNSVLAYYAFNKPTNKTFPGYGPWV